MTCRFVRVTAVGGGVHWVNLQHVRQMVVKKGGKAAPAHTTIHIDSYWVERVIHVSETPEQILGQTAGDQR